MNWTDIFKPFANPRLDALEVRVAALEKRNREADEATRESVRRFVETMAEGSSFQPRPTTRTYRV